MSEITQIINEFERGQLMAAERLLPLVYDEPHRLAAARMVAEAADHTLQPTSLA